MVTFQLMKLLCDQFQARAPYIVLFIIHYPISFLDLAPYLTHVCLCNSIIFYIIVLVMLYWVSITPTGILSGQYQTPLSNFNDPPGPERIKWEIYFAPSDTLLKVTLLSPQWLDYMGNMGKSMLMTGLPW